MSKLQRTEANLHLPEHQPDLSEAEHPRKEAIADYSDPAPAGKDQPSGSDRRHPLGHKVKNLDDVCKCAWKKEFLPYSDGPLTSDLYFQPKKIVEMGKSLCKVEVEELLNGGDELKWDTHVYSILASDLLKMLYLVDKADSVYYNMDIDGFDHWKVHHFSDFMQEDPTMDLFDDAKVAEKLMKKKEYPFALGRGSHLEVYFQMHFVHEYPASTDACCSRAANLNQLVCKAVGKGKFEYCIEARIFMLSDEVHERRIGDLLEDAIEESQPKV